MKREVLNNQDKDNSKPSHRSSQKVSSEVLERFSKLIVEDNKIKQITMRLPEERLQDKDHRTSSIEEVFSSLLNLPLEHTSNGQKDIKESEESSLKQVNRNLSISIRSVGKEEICWNVYFRPTTFTCSQSFCRACILKYISMTHPRGQTAPCAGN